MLDNSGLFEDTSSNKIDFHNTSTSNVVNMNSMFHKCHATFLDLSNFNTSNVKIMRNMFSHCYVISLDLSNFDTTNIRVMCNMFWCYNGSIKATDNNILATYNFGMVID